MWCQRFRLLRALSCSSKAYGKEGGGREKGLLKEKRRRTLPGIPGLSTRFSYLSSHPPPPAPAPPFDREETGKDMVSLLLIRLGAGLALPSRGGGNEERGGSLYPPCPCWKVEGR